MLSLRGRSIRLVQARRYALPAGVGSEDFPVQVEDGGINAVLDILFDLVQALGDLPGTGTESRDGPDRTVQRFVVGGFGHRQIRLPAPYRLHWRKRFALGLEVFAAIELEMQGENADMRCDIRMLWGFAFFQQFSQGF